MHKLSYRIKILMSTVLLTGSVSGEIIVQGFAPKNIDRAVIHYEYKRIWALLVPGVKPDTTRLIVTYYSNFHKTNEQFSLPEWSGGGAIGDDHIVVSIDKSPFLDHSPYQVTVHELVHIVINRACKGVAVPRWFHEGVAMTLSGDATDRENIVISKALFTGSIMPLNVIDSVNSFRRFRAELAYCQGRQAVAYLIDTYGIEVLAEILDAANKQQSFWKGFYEVLQISEKELEVFYLDYVLKHHGRFFWLLDTYLVWILILFLFFLAYTVTFFRIRAKRKRLEKEEALPDAES